MKTGRIAGLVVAVMLFAAVDSYAQVIVNINPPRRHQPVIYHAPPRPVYVEQPYYRHHRRPYAYHRGYRPAKVVYVQPGYGHRPHGHYKHHKHGNGHGRGHGRGR